MDRTPRFAVFAAVALCALGPGAAWADQVALLTPEKGPIALGVDAELRVVLASAGHQVLASVAAPPSESSRADATADGAEELRVVATNTGASWVLRWVARAQGETIRVELTAWYGPEGRTETVTRDLDRARMRAQLREMTDVLLRPEGVGTGALPWENATPPAVAADARSEQAPTLPPEPGGPVSPLVVQPTAPQPAPPERGIRWLAGAGLGTAYAVVRPDAATGTRASLLSEFRLGATVLDDLDAALEMRTHMTGPRAMGVDVSARYLLRLTDRVRLGPDVAVGFLITRGGAQETRLMLRASAAASYALTTHADLDIRVGDLSWLPASSDSYAGTLVLAGATANATYRF